MVRKKIIAVFIVLIPLCITADNMNKAKLFGIAGFTCSLMAIGTDMLGEYYYDQYENANTTGDCEYYRKRTVMCEWTRDISFGLAVISFSLSTISWLREKKQETGLKIRIHHQKLCIGFAKSL